MDVADLTQAGLEVSGFLLPKALKAASDRIEEPMADVAVIFHWPPSEMAAFSLSELMQWRERAIARVPKNE